ncbi:protein trapped in endoderm-1-like protein [Dinothrombium tinctorium]|uniref:Protein trapped in endoderm-1-like protein n=1 Tax=Dinothrombium tinctorium TaxID=1965070 RepID=A0A443RBZ0_9ACAR|nr:protein trapped in endoderm-1-like protein [Dinothrombium tinctorium]
MFRNASRQEDMFLPSGPQTLNFVVSMIVIPFGTLANALVIISLLKYAPKLRGDATTKFVINLAISDLMFSVITLPLRWIQHSLRANYKLSNELCRLQQVTFYWTFFLSLFSLTLVSLNRLKIK